jgi:hypothetical protein
MASRRVWSWASARPASSPRRADTGGSARETPRTSPGRTEVHVPAGLAEICAEIPAEISAEISAAIEAGARLIILSDRTNPADHSRPTAPKGVDVTPTPS